MVVTTGFVVTVRVAAVVVAGGLHVFVNTARYCFPLSAIVAVKVSIVEVSPGMSEKEPPLDTCHCTVGAGLPLEAALKLTIVPSQTVCVAGLLVTTGAVLTVRVAAVVAAVPQLFVKIARYCFPLSAAVVPNVSVPDVAPGMSVKVPPLETCH